MQILKTFDQMIGRLFYGQRKTKHYENQREMPVIVGQGFANNVFGFNFNELSPEKQRSAYRSLVQMLVSFRARNMCKGIVGAEIKRRSGKDLKDVEANNPWMKLLSRPNEHTAPSVVYNWMFQAIDMQGHADFMVQYAGILGTSMPIALHPIYPQFARVEPNFGSVGEIVSWAFDLHGGGTSNLPYEQVIRIKRPHPVAPWFTAGKIEAAAYEIDTLSAENIFSRDSANDQGKPRVMLEADKPLLRDQAITVAQDFAAMYSAGGPNAVPVSHSGLKIKPLTITPEQLDFIESKKFTREQLFTMFEVPISLFSGEAYATGSNSARTGFIENTVQPAVDDVAPQLEFEFERIFRVKKKGIMAIVPPNMVPVNKKEQSEIDRNRLASGTPLNRILAERGEDTVKGGDVALVPANLVPLELVSEGLQ